MRSTVSAFYFIILEILWTCRLVYEFIMPGNTLSGGNESNTDPYTNLEMDNERRHWIHLFTRPQEDTKRRPICYMHVCEIMSPAEQEMLRCACAKGIPETNNNKLQNINRITPPTQTISREKFTNLWVESFSLIV